MVPNRPPGTAYDEANQRPGPDKVKAVFFSVQRLGGQARIKMRCNNLDGTEDAAEGSAACAVGYWLLKEEMGRGRVVAVSTYHFEQANSLGEVKCSFILTQSY